MFKRAKKDSEKYKFFFRRRFVYALPEVSRVIDIESLNSKHYTHEGNASEREREGTHTRVMTLDRSFRI